MTIALLNLTYHQAAELRAITRLGVDNAIYSGEPTATQFAGVNIDIHRSDAFEQTVCSSTRVRCVISMCGRTIESHEIFLNENQSGDVAAGVKLSRVL
jgi:hypothetical protein